MPSGPLLARLGIDPSAIRGRWPELEERAGTTAAANGQADRIVAAHEGGSGLSGHLRLSIAAALPRLGGPAEPLALATEHLLLGLAAADDDVGRWLRDAWTQSGNECVRRNSARVWTLSCKRRD